MTQPEDAATDAADTRRLWALAACGLCLGACAAAFNLLYLFVPAGMSPHHGFAPDIGAAYARWLPRTPLVLTPRSFGRASLALQAGMWVAFFTAVYLARKLRGGPAERRAFTLIVVAAALASVALILTPPALSSDLYHYAVFGRMIITRGLNPYVTPGNALAGDPILALSNWRSFSTHYGPVFTGLSVLAAGAGGGSPIGTAIAFKTLATAFGALAAWAVVALARRQGRSALLPLVLLAWNPIVLVETAGSGHNEMVMIGLALAGLAVAERGRPNWGFALIVCSVHVKWVTAALLGLAVIVRVREATGARARVRTLGTLVAIAVGATVALYLPFWTGLGSVASIRRLMLTRRAGEGSQLHDVIAFCATVAGAIGVVLRTGRDHLLEMAALVCVAFVLFLFPWALPWYLIPAVTLLSVGPYTKTNVLLTALVTTLLVVLMAKWAPLISR